MRNLDKLAYDLTCNWYKSISFNPVYHGIDFSQIIRFYLWDKIGRAIRIKYKVDNGELSIYKPNMGKISYYHEPVISKGKFKKRILKREQLVFIPFAVASYLVNGFSDIKNVKIITKDVNIGLPKKSIITTKAKLIDDHWYIELYNNVLKALKINALELVPQDLRLLKEQIKGAFLISYYAEQELLKYKPNALFVYSDNHPPFINYVLAAKKIGIPSFTYQHGLDCEHYYLDDCFADYIAVWSENRKLRYIKHSAFEPKAYEVVGKIKRETHKVKRGKNGQKYILFITRPHKPIKCYSPSRSHDEGASILKAILDYMLLNSQLKLIIKSHPLDNAAIYSETLDSFPALREKVVLSEETIEHLAINCDVIITEDSTAGVEALVYGKPCVHAHFANSRPVLPFIEYGASFSGKSHKELVDSLKKCFAISNEDLYLMIGNQQKMVADFIPSGESENLVNFIIDNL
ncbi:capsular polysaccharide export protein, LipB/KpsS family [Hyunsoonleella rubra]|uniref:Uncharacterized protein n=1 Tax=Hyunsoonleella rubra TaxID=1737062 RepID=A0ABW5TH17_9FLAO